MPRQKRLAVFKKNGLGSGRVGAQPGNGNAMKSGVYGDLSRRNLDQRYKLARCLRAVEGELIVAVGGDPSPQEQILIQRISYKLAKCVLFEIASLNGGNGSDETYLSWSNSMRHDLALLGLQRRTRDVTPSLSQYLAGHYSQESEPEASGQARAEESAPASSLEETEEQT